MFLLRPVLAGAQQKESLKSDSKFNISDLLSLIFLIQFPLTLLNQESDRPRPNFLAYIIFLGVPLCVWLAGLISVNRLGINNQMKRVVAAGFVFPASVISGVAGMIICLALFNEQPRTLWVVAAVIWLAVVVTVFFLVQWILRKDQLKI